MIKQDSLNLISKGIRNIELILNNSLVGSLKSNHSLNYYYNEFIKYLKQSSSTQTTYIYTKILNKYFLPIFDVSYNCSQISISSIKKVRDNILSYKLKTRTINGIFICINKFLSFLVREEVISLDKNYKYKDILKLVKYKEVEDNYNYLLPSEISRLLKYIKNKKDKDFYLLFSCLFYGAFRIGELLALTFDDIDYPSSKVKISKSLNERNQISNCKTIYSSSTIFLPSRLIQEIKTYQKETGAKGSDFVFFPSHTYSRMTIKNKLSYYLNKIHIKKKITLHGLRHSMASYMFDLGISILDISKHLRHKNPSITLSVYTHKLSNDSKKIINRLDLGD